MGTKCQNVSYNCLDISSLVWIEPEKTSNIDFDLWECQDLSDTFLDIYFPCVFPRYISFLAQIPTTFVSIFDHNEMGILNVKETIDPTCCFLDPLAHFMDPLCNI